MPSITNRITNEIHVVTQLIRIAAKNGWHPTSVFDGAEWLSVSDAYEAIKAIFSVDASSIKFTSHLDTSDGVVKLVLGNSGASVITDWSSTTSIGFDTFNHQVMHKFGEWLSHNEEDLDNFEIA